MSHARECISGDVHLRKVTLRRGSEAREREALSSASAAPPRGRDTESAEEEVRPGRGGSSRTLLYALARVLRSAAVRSPAVREHETSLSCPVGRCPGCRAPVPAPLARTIYTFCDPDATHTVAHSNKVTVHTHSMDHGASGRMVIIRTHILGVAAQPQGWLVGVGPPNYSCVLAVTDTAEWVPVDRR